MAEIKIKKKYIIPSLIILVIIVAGAYFMNQEPQSDNQKVKIETSKGEIIVELYPEQAPKTVENFLTYVDMEFYNGLVFHRVIDDFMVQGGGFSPDGLEKKTIDPINLESDNGLKNEKGTIAMARTNDPNSATSQFFINDKDNAFLDYSPSNAGYAVFGKVVKGIEVVEEISGVETTTKNGAQDWPIDDVVILKISRV